MGMRDRIVGFNLMGKSSVESEASRIFGLSADLRGQEVFEVYFHCFFHGVFLRCFLWFLFRVLVTSSLLLVAGVGCL